MPEDKIQCAQCFLRDNENKRQNNMKMASVTCLRKDTIYTDKRINYFSNFKKLFGFQRIYAQSEHKQNLNIHVDNEEIVSQLKKKQIEALSQLQPESRPSVMEQLALTYIQRETGMERIKFIFKRK